VAEATPSAARGFLVSGAPSNALRTGVPAACEKSLKRLHRPIDLYLLHWPAPPLAKRSTRLKH
jgi:diketogulonate reductase-like aldo/keto reductase